MTEEQARKTANVVLAAAAVGAAVAVVCSPRLRRLVWGLARASAAPLAAYAMTTVRHAWDESGSLEYDRARAPAGASRLRWSPPHAPRHLARGRGRVPQRRPDVRVLHRVLRTAVAVSVFPAHAVDPRQRHLQ